MKIVHISPFYYPIVGGLEETVKRITEYLACKGYETYVLTYNRLRDGTCQILPRTEYVNNVQVIRLKPDFLFSYGTYSSELPNILEVIKPDIVHVHPWRHPHVFQVAKLRRRMKFKAILHVHAPFYKLNQLGFTVWFYHRLIDGFAKDILDSYDLLIAHTEFEKELLIQKFHIKSEKISVIPAGIEDSFLKVASSSFQKGEFLLYIGRIAKGKNLKLLLEALTYLKSRYNKRVKLIMVGPDEGLASKLILYCKKNNLDAIYLGKVNNETKTRLYESAIMLTHPAPYEAYGLTLLEAAAFGKPSVITGYGNHVYIAPPNLVSVWAKQNARDYGEAILKLLNDITLYKKLSSNAKKWASKYAWSKILPNYEYIYANVK
jgi:glycosyltransferase involved in cell wall biosynthesis